MRIDLQRRGLLLATAAAASLPRDGRAAGEDIVVGQIGPFTGMPAPDATELNLGIKAAFAQLNAAGGVNGRPLSLFELDDGYKEDGFEHQFGEALKRRPVALLAPVGTRAIQRMLDNKLLDQADLVVLNAVPGADSLRNPGHPRLFHIRASDRQQVERVVHHAVTLGITQMAVLYQDVPIGRSGLAAATKAAEALAVKLTPFMVPADVTQPSEAAARAGSSATQGVLVLGSPRFAAEGVVALRKASRGKFVYALSYVPPGLLKQLGQGAARGVALAQVYPNPNGSTLVLQHDFQAAMKRAGGAGGPAGAAGSGPFSAFHLEGYITARVLAEALRRGKDVSPAGLARALHAMGECDLGGYRVNFARDNVGSSFVDIAVINSDDRLVY